MALKGALLLAAVAVIAAVVHADGDLCRAHLNTGYPGYGYMYPAHFDFPSGQGIAVIDLNVQNACGGVYNTVAIEVNACGKATAYSVEPPPNVTFDRAHVRFSRSKVENTVRQYLTFYCARRVYNFNPKLQLKNDQQPQQPAVKV